MRSSTASLMAGSLLGTEYAMAASDSPTLKLVKDRGALNCTAHNGDYPGFAEIGKDGKWKVRDDVFVKFLRRKGPLTVGYGSPGRTGVELEFGTAMGERFEEPVILVKAAWGGHSLVRNFRPPSLADQLAGETPHVVTAGGTAAVIVAAYTALTVSWRPINRFAGWFFVPLGAATLYVCGITTNHCCETTARVGGNLGYDVLFALDATHTFDRAGPDGVVLSADELARATAASLHGEFAAVVSTQDLLR